MRNRLDVASETQQQRQHEHRAQRTRHLRLSASADVDHRSHGGPGAGNAADQPGNHVANPLADQLAVGVVPRAGQRVRDQGGKQTVHRAEQRENEGRLDSTHQERSRGQAEMKLRETARQRPDHRHTAQRQHPEQRADDQRNQRPRHEPGPPARPEHSHDQGGGGDGKGIEVDVAERIRQRPHRAHRSAQRRGRAQAPWGRRSATAYRRGWTGDLRPRTAEHRGKESDRDRTIQAGGRPQPRRHPEGQRDRQRHHRGGEAAEEIPAQRIEVVLHRLYRRNPDTRSGCHRGEGNPHAVNATSAVRGGCAPTS